MSLNIEINGVDEAGRIGENIIFTRVSVERDFEINLLLNNLSYFNQLIPNKNDVKGYDKKRLGRYAREIIETETFKTAIYKMRHESQVLLLRCLYSYLSEDLFRLRREVLSLFETKDWRVIQTALDSLNRFKRKGIFAESFVKAFGMKKVVEDLGKNYLQRYQSIEKLSSVSGPKIIVQIDGGFPFAFWWKDILKNTESGLVKGKCLITGVTNGDKYYPTMATAGAISNILRLHPELQYLFPIRELDIRGVKYEDMGRFYEQHSFSLSKPIYQNRILIIGKIINQMVCCVPYLFHIQEQRTKTFETFCISGSVDNFLRDFGYGTKENTTVVVGRLTSSLDKENLQYCRDKGYPIKYLSSLKTTFNDLINRLQSEIELAPSSKRYDLEGKLSRLNSACQHELE